MANARDFDLNVPAISDAALADAVAQAQANAWAEESAAAIAERWEWIRKNGMPLADIQVLRID